MNEDRWLAGDRVSGFDGGGPEAHFTDRRKPWLLAAVLRRPGTLATRRPGSHRHRPPDRGPTRRGSLATGRGDGTGLARHVDATLRQNAIGTPRERPRRGVG